MTRVLIGLLRGINVGGHHRLPMVTLVELLKALGAEDARTYIQSGNMVFRSAAEDLDALSGDITRAIESRCGFAPGVWLWDARTFADALSDRPFPEAEQAPATLHLAFCAGDPDAHGMQRLEALRVDSERIALRGRVFYLHAPDGIGRSKLAARIGQEMGTPLTMRNWRTVSRLQELAAAI